MGDVGTERTALDRMTRTMYFAIGIATIIFGVLLSGGPSGFRGQVHQVDAPLLWFSVVMVLLVPASFVVLGRILPLSVMRGLVTAVGISFVTTQLLFPLALVGDKLEQQGSPWMQGFGPIPATLIAVAWGGRITWVFALTQGPIIVFVSLAARDATLTQAVLDGLGSMVSSSIFAGVSLAVVLAAARLDSVAERAREQASLEARAVTREREQTRINAMVHDDIMSVLLAASRPSAPEGLASQARAALHSVEQLASAELATLPYAPEELVAVLRATVGETAPDIAFTYIIDSDDPTPRDVVAALSEATEEAIRNSLRHAGEHAQCSVEVTLATHGVEVAIADDGVGFVAREVPQRRLGLRVSIIQRMASIAGGEARVRSQPGAGTRVTLTWRRS
ncbi:sensor histidine kinase [Demequina sp.]|uniref:sensor histidine kinase n=1 Tax=Demequina sp. TaxID=2050685 RepID=UPI003D11C104